MKGIYREILEPGHVIKVIKRDEESISYEDGGRIVCTKRIKSFDRKFVKDETATLAALAADYISPQTTVHSPRPYPSEPVS